MSLFPRRTTRIMDNVRAQWPAHARRNPAGHLRASAWSAGAPAASEKHVAEVRGKVLACIGVGIRQTPDIVVVELFEFQNKMWGGIHPARRNSPGEAGRPVLRAPSLNAASRTLNRRWSLKRTEPQNTGTSVYLNRGRPYSVRVARAKRAQKHGEDPMPQPLFRMSGIHPTAH